MSQRIYFDNAMTSRPSDRAMAKMVSLMNDKWGTPSAPHQMGQDLIPAMQESYEAVFRMLGAEDYDDFIFTSSGAEAVNQAIWSTYFEVTRATGKNHYICCETDEAPALMSINRLEKLGCVGKLVKPNQHGVVDAAAIAEAITPRTAMLSLSWANGLTGVIHPVAEIAKLCKERKILFHLDATHVIGKLFFDLAEVGADMISFEGSHLHAPQGSGGLWIKKGTPIVSLIVGGLEQAGKRAGSINVPALVALGEASREVQESQNFICTEIARLRNKWEAHMKRIYPSAITFFQGQERLPHCTVIAFPGIANEALLFAFNRKELYASIGGGSLQQIALVLQAADIPAELAQTAISFSFSRYTTEEEVDKAAARVEEIVDLFKKVRG